MADFQGPTGKYNTNIVGDADIVYFFPLNETSGTNAEELVDNNDGTYNDGFILNQSGPCVDNQGGVDFDGSTGYMAGDSESSTSALQNDFTFEIWINPDVAPATLVLLGEVSARQNVVSNIHIRVMLRTDQLIEFRIGSNANRLDTVGVSAVPLGVWTHVVCTRSGILNSTSSAKIFLDTVDEGVDGSGGHAALGAGMIPSVGATVFTNPPDTQFNFFDGKLSKFAIYEKELTQSEIDANNDCCLITEVYRLVNNEGLLSSRANYSLVT